MNSEIVMNSMFENNLNSSSSVILYLLLIDHDDIIRPQVRGFFKRPGKGMGRLQGRDQPFFLHCHLGSLDILVGLSHSFDYHPEIT